MRDRLFLISGLQKRSCLLRFYYELLITSLSSRRQDIEIQQSLHLIQNCGRHFRLTRA